MFQKHICVTSSLVMNKNKNTGLVILILIHDYNNNNNNNNNLFNLSSFTISQANYQLTFGYHGIASSFFTYN
jgi:hypothetical protein